MLKKNLEKLISPVKWSAWLYASALQNFAARHFFDVNKDFIVFSRERGEIIEQNLKGKLEFNVVAYSVTAR